LQDARSSAAVGFDLVSFSLERGHNQKLPAKLIWNMVNWLSGPETVLELDLNSLPELEEVGDSFEYQWVGFPAEDWNSRLLAEFPAVILRADASLSPAQLQTWLQEAEAAGKTLLCQLSVPNAAAVEGFRELLPYLLLHFPDLDQLQAFAATAPAVPRGFVMETEAEEAPGLLDYQRIDEFMEVFEARFGED
jgi:hypothetical protein